VNEFIGPVMTAVALVVILGFMLRGMRPRGGPGSAGARRWSDLRRYHDADRVGGWITGLVACLALTGFEAAVGAGTTTIVTTAVLTGIAFAVLNAVDAARTSMLLAGAAGVLGIGATAIGLAQSADCDASSFALRGATFALLLTVATLSTVARVVTGRPLSLSPLAAFGALEVIGFLAGPFGTSPFTARQPALAVTLAIAAAIGFGVLVAVAPRVAVGLGGVTVALTSIGMAAGLGDCGSGADNSSLVALVCFAALYAIVSMLALPLKRVSA
jgi:hypothetical protein